MDKTTPKPSRAHDDEARRKMSEKMKAFHLRTHAGTATFNRRKAGAAAQRRILRKRPSV